MDVRLKDKLVDVQGSCVHRLPVVMGVPSMTMGMRSIVRAMIITGIVPQCECRRMRILNVCWLVDYLLYFI